MAEIAALLLGDCLEPTTLAAAVVVVNTRSEPSRLLLAKHWTSSSRRPGPRFNAVPRSSFRLLLALMAAMAVSLVAQVELVELVDLLMEL